MESRLASSREDADRSTSLKSEFARFADFKTLLLQTLTTCCQQKALDMLTWSFGVAAMAHMQGSGSTACHGSEKSWALDKDHADGCNSEQRGYPAWKATAPTSPSEAPNQGCGLRVMKGQDDKA